MKSKNILKLKLTGQNSKNAQREMYSFKYLYQKRSLKSKPKFLFQETRKQNQ